jgi:hypothetical protein
MATTNSCGEMDLGPRRVGIHFRKLACRSDAVDEVLTEGRLNGLDFGARARSTGPPHEGEPARPGRARVMYRRSFWVGRLRRYGVCRRATAGQSRFSTNTRGPRPREAVQRGDEADEGRLEARGTMELGRHLGRTAVIVRGHRRSRPSQLIASVGRTCIALARPACDTLSPNWRC